MQLSTGVGGGVGWGGGVASQALALAFQLVPAGQTHCPFCSTFPPWHCG